MAKWGKIGSPKSATRKAWLAKIRKKLPSRKKTKTTKRKTNKAKKTKKSTGKKKMGRRGIFNVSTIFKYLRIGALVAPAVGTALDPNISNPDKIRVAFRRYSGYDWKLNKFDASWLAEGWMPYIVTTLVTNGVQKLSAMIRGL